MGRVGFSGVQRIWILLNPSSVHMLPMGQMATGGGTQPVGEKLYQIMPGGVGGE